MIIKPLIFTTTLILMVILSGCSSSPYSGDLYSGEPHGYGTYRYEDGTLYEGQFRYGKRYGFGTLTHPDGTSEKVAYNYGRRIYTEEGVKNMQRGMRRIDQSVANNMAIRAASERADMLAIEKDRKRRNTLPDFNAFRDGPNLTGGLDTTQVYSGTTYPNAPTHHPHPSGTGQYGASNICQNYNDKWARGIYKTDLEEARSCHQQGESKCDATLSNAYAYGRRAKKYLHQCGPALYRLILSNGKTLCLASAMTKTQKQSCYQDFDRENGVFQ